MTLVRERDAQTDTGVKIVSTAEGLTALRDPGCAAVLWRRAEIPGRRAWLAALSPESLPKVRTTLRADQVQKAVADICDASDLPAVPLREHLVKDIADLADAFGSLMRAPYLRLRLERVTTNACRKFHIDAVTARLVCTYRGTGTQYGITKDDADPQNVFTVPTGDPILLRGTVWPSKTTARCLHRSPPIEGTGETRLVLVLDPVFDPEDDL